MTKAQEMAVYDEMVARLGTDSYLGPWLAGMRDAVAADILNDFGPEPLSPLVAYTRARDIVEAAVTASKAIGQRARKDAEDLEANAHRVASDIRQGARQDPLGLASKL